jgi:hypothetical protein
MWVAADAVSAYCVNFEVYVGKNDTAINRTFGLSSRVVIEITKFLELKGYVIFTDNFYTSLFILRCMKGREIINNSVIFPKRCKQWPTHKPIKITSFKSPLFSLRFH